MTHQSTPPSVEVSEVLEVPTSSLRLDPYNPRLMSNGSEVGEVKIITQLYRVESLNDLLQSVATNGYMDLEPLIVLKEGEAFIVLEGNRRLAAIRLLKDPELVSRISTEEGLRITLPDMPTKLRSTLDTVSVYQVHDRADVRSYIGFKHIKGAARWKSYAKAKYAADWYHKSDDSLDKIAAAIGDKHATVKRMVHAIYVLDQADSTEIFNINDVKSSRFNFSHLYTALSRGAYREYLGLSGNWAQYDPVENPISSDRLDRLQEVLRWLYGSESEDIDPVIQSQNPHIKQLGEVLDSEEGLAVLKSVDSLREAYASTQSASDKFGTALTKARVEIRRAVNSLRGYDGQDQGLSAIAEDIVETAKVIHRRMQEKMAGRA